MEDFYFLLIAKRFESDTSRSKLGRCMVAWLSDRSCYLVIIINTDVRIPKTIPKQ